MSKVVTPDWESELLKEAEQADAAQEAHKAREEREQREKAAALEDAGFEFGKNGALVANSQKNIRLAIAELGAELRYDEFADRLQIKRFSRDWELLNDPAIDRTWLEIDERLRFRPSRQFFQTVLLDHARACAFHPVRDYLNGLVWDGTERLDKWLVNYFGAEDTEFVRTVGRLVLVAAVRRVRKPGVKFDEMLVLESGQGLGKSQALAALCPDPEWFTDDLPMNVDSKVVIERTAGKWIVEAAELSGMRRGDIEHIKSFLSRQTDRARLAYDRATTERGRHFIVVGTTNNDSYLKDESGNRRFWPVRVSEIDVSALARDRDQLWAEAARIEARGDLIRLPRELWVLAGDEQDQRRVVDPWEEAIAQAIGEQEGKIATAEIWRIVGIEDVGRRKQADNERIGRVTQRLGFERTRLRIKAKLQYAYVRGDDREREIEVAF